MSQYIVRMVHPPDQCPSSNSKVRERITKGGPDLPKIAQKCGIRFVAGPLLLALEHESITVVESGGPEAIHQFILESGLSQWNTVRITPAQSLESAMKELEKAPPPLY